MTELLNSLTPILVTSIQAILVVVIPLLAKIVIKLIKTKLVELENKVGEQNYNAIFTVAQDIYFEVEQRFINGYITDKREEFDKLLLDKVPTLTQEEIDKTREAICGKINSYLK